MNLIFSKNIPQLVAFITREITSREDKKAHWARLKKNHNNELCEILGVNPSWGITAGSLIGFDVDEKRKLVLLNYSATAHNLLHEIDGGWTPVLRQMRGLVCSYEAPGNPAGVKLVSRGFEKFFNQSELPETSITQLAKDTAGVSFECSAKEDGHMIEYFMHDRKLCATTRGKLNTPSAEASLDMIDRVSFIRAGVIVKRFKKDLLSLVCEFVHPMTRVHVDYGDSKKIFLLEAYDTNGDALGRNILEKIEAEMQDVFVLPEKQSMTLEELVSEIENRSIHNREGWVAQIPTPDGGHRRIKFKYIAYIGEMVKSKLSYKYLMNCIKNERLDKMLITLPEEIREVAYNMVDEIISITNGAVPDGDLGYKQLYNLYTPTEGGIEYFRTVCRAYYRDIISTGGKKEETLIFSL